MILFPLFSTGVVGTGAKFATGSVDTGGKFATGVVDNGGKFAAGIVDTKNLVTLSLSPNAQIPQEYCLLLSRRVKNPHP